MISTNNSLNQNKKRLHYESQNLELITYLEEVKNFPLDKGSVDLFVDFFLKKMRIKISIESVVSSMK